MALCQKMHIKKFIKFIQKDKNRYKKSMLSRYKIRGLT